jgi:NitT/TauT family transport system substrate-binding protein
MRSAFANLVCYRAQKMRRLSSLACAIALVAGCSRTEPEPLRIAVIPWPGYEPFFLAEHLNAFEAEGVRVRLVEQSSLKDSRRIYARGLVDGLLATPMDLAAIEADGARAATPLLAFDYSSGGDAIVARAECKSMQDLHGKRVAIEQGLGEYFLTRALESSGMKASDVQVVYLPYAAAEQALRAGEVAAVHSFVPILRQLTNDGDAHFNVLFTSREMPNEIVDILLVGPESAAARGDDLQRIERAYDRARRYMREQPEDAYRILAAREGISPHEMQEVFRDEITMIPAADRAAYLSATGHVVKATLRTHDILREYRGASGRIDGVSSKAASVSTRPGVTQH